VPDTQDGTVPISSAIKAHGGVSFAGDLSGHLDQPQLAGWWFGFDCAHAGDMLKVPMMDERTRIAPSMSRGEYRDIEYVHELGEATESERVGKEHLTCGT